MPTKPFGLREGCWSSITAIAVMQGQGRARVAGVPRNLESVDDYDFDMESKAGLIKNGVPKEVMD
jgi:hypothetical protein